MDAIVTAGLSKSFVEATGWRWFRSGKPITAVQDITLAIPQGEIFGLMGPNGAGKTTLVKLLCTLVVPTRGRALVAGHSLQDEQAIRAAVGLVVAEERSFFWRLTARQNLTFFAALHGLNGAVAQRRIDDLLTAVSLHGAADRRFSHFSTGMRQRLAIARSLLHQPRILFLDEPGRSLDADARARLHQLLRNLRDQQGMTLFLVTHDAAEADALCDRVVQMQAGRLVQNGRLPATGG